MMTQLTARQNQVLEFIRNHLECNQVPPTRAEIAQGLGFRSPNAAEEHLKALARKGAIIMIPGASRGIRLVDAEPTQPDIIEAMPAANDPLPIIGRVAAGSPTLAAEHIEGHCAAAQLFQPRADFLLRVHGLSMKDMGIVDDDLVAVEKTQQIKNGDVVVARVNGEVTLKRFYREADHIRLVAENEDFSDIIVTEADDFAIEGRYVGMLRGVTIN
jgi:repressor LexA